MESVVSYEYAKGNDSDPNQIEYPESKTNKENVEVVSELDVMEIDEELIHGNGTKNSTGDNVDDLITALILFKTNIDVYWIAGNWSNVKVF